jgi:hypothetical protein
MAGNHQIYGHIRCMYAVLSIRCQPYAVFVLGRSAKSYCWKGYLLTPAVGCECFVCFIFIWMVLLVQLNEWFYEKRCVFHLHMIGSSYTAEWVAQHDSCCVGALQKNKEIGLARTLYIRCIYGIFGREITKYTVIYGAYIRFRPTLQREHEKKREARYLLSKSKCCSMCVLYLTICYIFILVYKNLISII